mgnify:CR=1 FL=1
MTDAATIDNAQQPQGGGFEGAQSTDRRSLVALLTESVD